MSEHSWCQNIPRDEAVRAAEDGRSGPLPTLEDVIARPFANTQGTCEQSAPAPPFAQPAKCSPAVSETGETQSRLRTKRVTERRPPQPVGGENVTLRTERVTLEITHSVPVARWDWANILETYRPGESVRVVEEAHFDDLAQVALERDAAIRERDTLRAERITQGLTADRFAAAVAEADTMRNRVAELEEQLESVADRAATAETALESAAKIAPAANADGGSNHAAPAASGAARTGWLTAEERRWVPVGERLPPVQGDDVLTLSFFSDGSALVCLGWHNGREWMQYHGRGPGLSVTHWQPLPPGPEPKEANRE